MDIFPTIAAIVGLADSVMLQPQDGVSLLSLFTEEAVRRDKPIPFHCLGNSALLDNNYKLIHLGKKPAESRYELYDLRQRSEGRNQFVCNSRRTCSAPSHGDGRVAFFDGRQRGGE